MNLFRTARTACYLVLAGMALTIAARDDETNKKTNHYVQRPRRDPREFI